MYFESLKIVIDTREKTPLFFHNLPSEKGTLLTGDYSIKGMENRFVVERKTIPDLVQSLTWNRDRFERECHRLRGFDFARLLIVGDTLELGRYLMSRKVSKSEIMGRLDAFEVRYNLPIVWESEPTLAANMVEKWAWAFYQEARRPFNAYAPPVMKMNRNW